MAMLFRQAQQRITVKINGAFDLMDGAFKTPRLIVTDW
jgi:hypothetical protein